MEDAQYWSKRPKNDKRVDWRTGGGWITEYWHSQDHPHRKLIIENLIDLPFKFSSLLEIGCNCGPNLALIQKQFSKASLIGMDINVDSILKGMKEMPDVDFRVVNINKPFSVKPPTDIVLLDAVLMYISPENIEKVMTRVNKSARRGIIIIDWYDESELGIEKDFHWARNYTKILEDFDFDVKVIKLNKETWPSEIWAKHGRLFIGTK